MSEAYQSGNRPLRIEWIAETTEGVTPSDPDWNLFSDSVMGRWDTEPDANTTAQRPSGTSKPAGFFNGSETWSASFNYDLQQWFQDGSGNTVDAAGDFLDVNADFSVKATHSVVERTEHSTGGTAGGGRRIYTVGKGGHPSSVTLPFETEDGTPINVGLEYQFEKIRQYSVSQPAASTTLYVQSTDASDTTQTLTIEDEGAATTEDVALNGTTAQQTTASFADIDAASLDSQTIGKVEVYDGDPGASGTLLLTINGSDAYPADEGDLGIPALGAGSHASALGSSYVIFNNDTLEYSSGVISEEVVSGELSVDLGLGTNSQTGTQRMNIHSDSWTGEVTASVAGPDVSPQQFEAYLTEQSFDVVWTADEGTVTLNDARLTSPGSYSPEPEQGKLLLDSTYEGEDITITTT